MRASVLGPDLFDAERHLEITFRSTDVRLSDDGRAERAIRRRIGWWRLRQLALQHFDRLRRASVAGGASARAGS
jgi:hypothetical protein